MKSVIRAAFAAAMLFAADPALAKNELSPADLSALKGYTLSMDKINAMQAAMDEAEKSGKHEDMTKVGEAKSVAEMESRLKAMPGVMAVFTKHGLGAHDVVVMPIALMDAGMCVAYPAAASKLADRVSPAQITFYKQHQAELKKVKWLNGG